MTGTRRPTYVQAAARWLTAVAFVSAQFPALASAQPSPPQSETPTTETPPPEPPADPTVAKARAEYQRGVGFVKSASWARALSAFERSFVLRPHATTTFNIAQCERAMGRYTKAKLRFNAALEQHRQSGGTELAASLVEEAKGYVAEIDRALVTLNLVVEPATAKLAVDGRPLRQVGAQYLAGVEAPGPGRVVPSSRFAVVVDPGTHVFTVSRTGYEDVVVSRTYAPGKTAGLDLRLRLLPAELKISANQPGAIVRLDGRDVGPAPLSLLRPAGRYRLEMTKDGFEPYETSVDVAPGQRADLSAKLIQEKQSITGQWWFWAGIGAVVVAGSLITYALTRPEPDPPPYDRGNTGWLVEPLGFHF